MTPSAEAMPMVALVGPTATGKSRLAVAVAQAMSGEVVNADPQLFYKGMDIGTAKPTQAERRGVPHHRLDTLDVVDEASVARYQAEALGDLEAIRSRGAIPVVVGGSGLYLRALLDDLDLPPTDPSLRARIEARAVEVGPEVLHGELREADPEAAMRIPASNTRRVIRALEVIALQGSFTASLPERRYRRPAVQIGLDLDPDTLDRVIEHRAEKMWDSGLLDETEGLIEVGLRDGRTASKAIGYSEALQVLDGTLTREEAVVSTIQRTRRLARRQRKWFRPDPRIQWIDGLTTSEDCFRAEGDILRLLGTVES